jgi:addiction module HigA family antidote
MSELERKRPPLHPGVVIHDALEEQPVVQIAEQLGVSAEDLQAVLDGRAPVTPELALRLGRLFGNGPDLWLALQTKYDRARLAAELARIPEPA